MNIRMLKRIKKYIPNELNDYQVITELIEALTECLKKIQYSYHVCNKINSLVIVQLIRKAWPIRQIERIWVNLINVKEFDKLLIHKAGLWLCIKSILPENRR